MQKDAVEKGKEIFDRIYFWSAYLMPLRWHWQWNYVTEARFYFEARYWKRERAREDLQALEEEK